MHCTLALTLSALLAFPALGVEPSVDSAAAVGCRGTKIPTLLVKARTQFHAGAFRAAIEKFEEIQTLGDFDSCTPDLRFNVWKEHGDALTRLAKEQPNEAAAERLDFALQSYREALAAFKAAPWQLRGPEVAEKPRVVLNAIVQALFTQNRPSELCDYAESVADSHPDLLDLRVVEVWRKAIEQGWDDIDRTARLAKFCSTPNVKTRIAPRALNERTNRQCAA